VCLRAAQLASNLRQGEQLSLWFHAIPPTDTSEELEAMDRANLIEGALMGNTCSA